MSCDCDLQEGDIGTQLIVQIKEDNAVVDISSATGLFIIIQKPDRTSVTKNASFYTDGSDGKISYTTISGDINDNGKYKIQGKVLDSGGTFLTNIGYFKVKCSL